MMLYPPMANLLEKVNSRYMLVNAVATRARALALEAEENGEALDKKPVSIAIDEIASGKYVVNQGSERTEAEL